MNQDGAAAAPPGLETARRYLPQIRTLMIGSKGPPPSAVNDDRMPIDL